ncbi:MAG TPA: hypothetical protein VGA48_09470 [Thermoplasmata archaeon]
MSGPTAGPSPETPISVPSSGSPPYGAPPFPQMYYPAPPPRRDNLALIIVVVVVVALVSVVISAVLYILVSGLIRAPNPPPIVAFGPVEMTGGNATIDVSTSREIAPSSLQVRLMANDSGSSNSMPLPNGSIVLIAGGYILRVFWLDQDNDQLFGFGDVLRVTGDSAPLPGSTTFRLDLLATGMLAGVTWITP